MKKWLDKYENGGEFLGTTNKGFDYNGAWGGTMQMGGGLPGATGMMYARVGAPANGKYAKKTKASAQNGMEMKYYQAGLDFKPKTISQDGTAVKKPRTDMLTMDEYRLQQALANQPQIGPSSKPINIEERNRKNKQYAQQQGRKYNERTGAVEPLVSANAERTMNKIAENIVEPMILLSPMGEVGLAADVAKGATSVIRGATAAAIKPKAVSSAIKKVIGKQLHEKIPAGTPFNTRALASDVTITEEGNRILKRLDSPEGRRRLSEQIKRADPSLNDKQVEWITNSRLNEINTAVNYNKSRFYLEHIKGKDAEHLKNIPTSEFLPMGNAHWSEFNYFPGIRNIEAPYGLFPKTAASSNVSSGRFNFAKPTVEDNLKEFANPNYRPGSIALGTGLEFNKGVVAHEMMHAVQNKGVTPVDVDLLNLLQPKNAADQLFRAGVRFSPTGLGQDLKYFTTSGGRSAKSEPYAFLEELRNRMLNRGIIKDDYEKITPWKLVKARLDAARQLESNFEEGTRLIKFTPPWKYGKLADIMNVAPASVPVVGAATLLGNEEEIPKQKDGGITKDDMGYWNPENWGEPVEIDSNQITMQGVYEPLIGISDTGDVQYMEPGEDYEFDGESVIEYPLAKNGVSVNDADAEPIKKLDQLLNFTNYNKPTTGGWLDKYQ